MFDELQEIFLMTGTLLFKSAPPPRVEVSRMLDVFYLLNC